MNKIKLYVLKCYLFFLRKKKDRIEQIRFADGAVIEVVVLKKNKHKSGAQMVPILNTIIVDDSLFKDYSKTVQKFILEHEYAHFKVRWFLNLIILPILLISGLLWMLNFIFLPIFIVASIWIELAKSGVYPAALSILIFLPIFSMISWIVEFHADYSAMKAVSYEHAKEAIKEINSKMRWTLYKTIRYVLTHPPSRLTLWLFKLIKFSL